MSNLVFNEIFPNKCAVCGMVTEKALCKSCESRIKRHSKSIIWDENTSVISGFSFKTRGVSSMIYKLKSNGNTEIADYFANGMVERLIKKIKPLKIDAVTFVPVSSLKKRFKGFDHAEILAKSVADKMGVELISPPIKRVMFRAQKHKKREKRIRDGVRMFAPNGKSVEGVILLVDDVVTTGTTLKVCSKLLRQAGAKKIYCVSAAFSDDKR